MVDSYVVPIELNTSRASRNLTSFMGLMKSFHTQTMGARQGTAALQKSLMTLAGGLGLGYAIRRVQEYLDVWILASNRIRLITGNTSQLVAVTRELYNVSQRTRSSFLANAELFQRLGRNITDMGVSMKNVTELTETIAQAIAVSGVNARTASNALIQLGQAFSSGYLRGDELRSVLEQLPRVARAIAEGLGVTIGQLRILGEEGRLTRDAVYGAIQSQAKAIFEDFQKVQITIGQGWQVFENAVTRFIGGGGEAIGVTKLFAESLRFLGRSIDAVRESGTSYLGEFLYPVIEATYDYMKQAQQNQSIMRNVGAVGANLAEIVGVIAALGILRLSFTGLYRIAVYALSPLFMLASKLHPAAAIIAGIVAALYVLKDVTFNWGDSLISVQAILKTLWDYVVDIGEYVASPEFFDWNKPKSGMVDYFDTLVEKYTKFKILFKYMQDESLWKKFFTPGEVFGAQRKSSKEAFDRIYREFAANSPIQSGIAIDPWKEVVDFWTSEFPKALQQNVDAVKDSVEGVSDEAGEKIFELSRTEENRIKSLYSQLFPVQAEIKNTTEDIETLSYAIDKVIDSERRSLQRDYEKGGVTEEKRAMILEDLANKEERWLGIRERLKQQLIEMQVPMREYFKGLQQEIDLSSEWGVEKKIAEELYKAEEAAKKKNIELSETQIGMIKAGVFVKEEENRIAKVTGALYDDMVGATRNYNDSLQAITALEGEAGITKDDLSSKLAQLRDEYERMINPMKQYSDQLEKESRYALMGEREAQIEQNLDSIRQQFLELGKIHLFNEDEIRRILEATYDVQEYATSRRGVLGAIEGPLKAVTDDLSILNDLKREGAVTEEQYNRYHMMWSDQLKNLLDPMHRINEELDQEITLLQMSAKERQIEAQVMRIQNEMRTEGIVLSEQETEKLREKIKAIEEGNRIQQMELRILEDLRGPMEEFGDQQAALNKMLAEGTITQEEFVRGMRSMQIAMLGYRTDAYSGALRALLSLSEEAQNSAKNMEDVFLSAASAIEDEFVSLFTTLEFDVKNLAAQIQTDITRMLTRQYITGPMYSSLAGVMGGVSGSSTGAPWQGFLGSMMFGGGGGFLGLFDDGGVSKGKGVYASKVDELHISLAKLADLERQGMVTRGPGLFPTTQDLLHIPLNKINTDRWMSSTPPSSYVPPSVGGNSWDIDNTRNNANVEITLNNFMGSGRGSRPLRTTTTKNERQKAREILAGIKGYL